MWLAASSSELPEGFLAILTTAQLNRKPHQGVPSKNPASHPALGERNSTAAIGLRAGLALNGLRQSERARYYGGALGRFTSPDWSEQPDTVPYAEFENPQTLNLYSYARNNPLTYNDPDGHDVNVCLNDENGNQHCQQMTNDQYAASSKGNPGTNVPTLDQVGMNGNGSGSFNATNITDSNGNAIGTATYVSNGGADYYANRNGINFLIYQTAPVVNGLAYATGGVMAGAGIGAGYGAIAGGSSLITLGAIPAGLQPGAVVGGFVLTEHAVEQAAERGVTLRDIEEAVEGVAKGNPNPARAWDSVVRFYGANCEVRVNRITGTIVTVIKKSNR